MVAVTLTAVEGAGVAVGAPERRALTGPVPAAPQQANAVGADVQHPVVQALGRARAPERPALGVTRTVKAASPLTYILGILILPGYS